MDVRSGSISRPRPYACQGKCRRCKGSISRLPEAGVAQKIRLSDVMQNVAQRIDIAQKHLVQPMQSRNSLRRDSILVELAQANFDRFRVDQGRPKLFFDQLQYVVHPCFDAINLDRDYPSL